METTETGPTVARRDDEWVEIPAYFADGGYAGEAINERNLELRPGTSDERVRLTVSGYDIEVDRDSLKAAIAMVGAGWE
jgi:hypothetical protein